MTIDEFKSKISKNIEFFKQEIKSLRSSSANIGIVEDIKVNVYGSNMPISQIATITVPDVNLILIQPWDSSNIDPICNAITNLNIGINPIKSVNEIKLPIPPLSEERRKDFIKILNLKMEESKISMRNLRKEYLNKIKKDFDNSEIREDDFKRDEEMVDSIIKEKTKELQDIHDEKREDLLKV